MQAKKRLTALPARRTGQPHTRTTEAAHQVKLAEPSAAGQEERSFQMTTAALPVLPAGQTISGKPAYEIRRRGRFWEVLDSAGELVCMTVYKRGAKEVVRRLRGE